MAVLVICDNCSKQLAVKESVASRQKTFSCSNYCRIANLVKRNKSRKQTATLVCPQCSKRFKVRACDVKKHRFCSFACRSDYYREHPQEHPQWEGGLISKTCPVCKREFRVKRSHTWRIYCSEECYFQSWGIKGFRNKPTKPEKHLAGILDTYLSNQWQYNGDGQIRVGRRYPDFIHCNGHKAVIELFGDYWHSAQMIGSDWRRSELGTIMAYNSLGYRCLVIWEHELKDEQNVVAKVEQFIKGVLK